MRDRVGGWFFSNLGEEIGDGGETLFWKERWAGNATLKLSFPRHYNLCSDKLAKVGDMGEWGEEVWFW